MEIKYEMYSNRPIGRPNSLYGDLLSIGLTGAGLAKWILRINKHEYSLRNGTLWIQPESSLHGCQLHWRNPALFLKPVAVPSRFFASVLRLQPKTWTIPQHRDK